LAEAVEEGGVSGVVEGMPPVGEHVAAEAAMHVPDDARAPVVRGRVSDGEFANLDLLPPVHLDHLFKAEIEDDVADILRDDDDRRTSGLALGGAGNGTQRWPMQMIKVRMGDE